MATERMQTDAMDQPATCSKSIPQVGGSKGTKRSIIRVDPDDINREVSDTKRTKIELDPGKKVNVLAFVIGSNALIASDLGLFNEFKYDIGISMQVHNIVFSTHNSLRQRANNITSSLSKVHEKTSFKVTIGDKEHPMTREAAVLSLELVAKSCGLAYKKYELDDPESLSIMSS